MKGKFLPFVMTDDWQEKVWMWLLVDTALSKMKIVPTPNLIPFP
ncbi:hypothetical protein OGM63_01935 [Plectonema radiosum NIES-515]|uniref:Uncharacterized protein n=1 Tax=Plectonema radiosum NIES-515 TaxID=2986073 RepID=A0ABT3AT64_9CYAN|nr:hypothetical protein [Plectonema radiosum]MCV3212299.1 hypothetical protein [Plectonema radiosum NIES-515]